MNQPRADRATSEADLLLLWDSDDVAQAQERRPAFDWTDESDRESPLTRPASSVDTSAPTRRPETVERFVETWLDSPVGVGDPSTSDAVRSALRANSERRNPVRALYETVADVFEKDVEIADLLQVPEEEVREWKRGTASDAEALDRLENLSAAVSKLRGVYETEVIPDWIGGVNGYLGTRPIDVLVRGQLSRVIAAIEAERGGAHT